MDLSEKDLGFKPATALDDGIGKFIRWYKDYFKA